MLRKNQYIQWGRSAPMVLVLLAGYETVKAETTVAGNPSEATVIELEDFGGLDLEQLS
ncbi:MAG: hypothetical protein PVI92_14510 [Chromatiales bacterium]|jgi:hypothetical protein